MIRLETQKHRPTTRTLRGLGMDYYDLLNQAGREDCDPRDSGCVMRNQQRANAVEDVWLNYMSSSSGAPAGTVIKVNVDSSQQALDAYMNNQPQTTETVTVTVPTAAPVTYSDKQLEATPYLLPAAKSPYNAPPVKAAATVAAPAAATAGRITFTNTSGGSNTQLLSGDYWLVAISGAAPLSPVSVIGGNNGVVANSPTGTTDAAGNFTLAGQVKDKDIGVWKEQWVVGGVTAGNLAFTVTAKPAPLVTAGAGALSPTGAPAETPTATPTGTFFGGANPVSALLQEILPASLSGQPWYVLAGGAAAILFVFHSMTKGGRR